MHDTVDEFGAHNLEDWRPWAEAYSELYVAVRAYVLGITDLEDLGEVIQFTRKYVDEQLRIPYARLDYVIQELNKGSGAVGRAADRVKPGPTGR